MLTTLKLLLPALIPSWRFFSGVAPSPRVEYAVLGGDPPVWREYRPRPAHLPVWRMVLRLLWNPRWNDALYLVALSERLAEHETDHSIREIETRVREEFSGIKPAAQLQFRLMFVHREGEDLLREEGYRSVPFLPQEDASDGV